MTDRITTLLQAHDPAIGKSLDEFDRTRMLHHAGAARPRRVRRLAAGLAMAALLAGGIVIFNRAPRRQTAVQRDTVRQIQYATPGGTRIVWTLDPNFHM
jgi:hypothetical protein